MQQHPYHFEQVNLLALFVSAFDDAFVYRYDANTRTQKERIDVRYINGPKHRVMQDLNDRAKTLTLPVVTIEQTGFKKDLSRILNKNKKFKYEDSDKRIWTVPTPVPVNLELSVSIIAKFKEDLDQIIHNFAVNCNPYIIVSWKEPEAFGLPFLNEIKTEIQWSGDVNIDTPKNLTSDDKIRITAETSFTIKGWIFPPYENPVAPIYYIDANFHAVDSGTNLKYYTYDDYHTLSAISLDTDNLTISAIPSFTNAFYVYGSNRFPILTSISIKNSENNKFIFYGNMFDRENKFYLSANTPNFYTNFELISTAKSELVSGYRIPDEWLNVSNDEVFSVILSADVLSVAGDFQFITSNEAGWTVNPINPISLQID